MSRAALVIVVALACCVTYVHSLQMVGGLREEKAADEEVRNLVSKMKSQVEKLSNKTYKSLEPISYRTQVVAGMNYFIKAVATEKDGAKSHVHIRIYKPFRGESELTAVKTDVTKHTPIAYFQ